MRMRLFLPVFLLLLCCEAHAVTLMEVKDINVYEQSGTPEEAKSKAIEVGRMAAFMQLVADLISDADYSRLPLLKDGDIAPAVVGFRAENELAGDKSYRATVHYTFDKEAVESLLDQYDVLFKEYYKPPILVIPLLNVEEDYILWEGDNPWEAAWNKLTLQEKKQFVFIPLGDIDDLRYAKLSDILSRDANVFKEMRSRYDAAYVVLAEAHLFGDRLRVMLEPVGESELQPSENEYALTDDQEMSFFFETVVKDQLAHIEEFRRLMEEEKNSVNRVEIEVKVAKLKDFVTLKNGIAGLPLVKSLNVKSISSQSVVIELTFRDEVATMLAYLDTQGFPVKRNGPGFVMEYKP